MFVCREVVMQGLQLLVRLMRHHSETVHTHLHSIIVAVAKQVRNLRSQVARAACQASSELFLSQKRAVETVSIFNNYQYYIKSQEIVIVETQDKTYIFKEGDG